MFFMEGIQVFWRTGKMPLVHALVGKEAVLSYDFVMLKGEISEKVDVSRLCRIASLVRLWDEN